MGPGLQRAQALAKSPEVYQVKRFDGLDWIALGCEIDAGMICVLVWFLPNIDNFAAIASTPDKSSDFCEDLVKSTQENRSMAVMACSGCSRLISISMVPGGNPAALADPEHFSMSRRLCHGCGQQYCDRCAPTSLVNVLCSCQCPLSAATTSPEDPLPTPDSRSKRVRFERVGWLAYHAIIGVIPIFLLAFWLTLQFGWSINWLVAVHVLASLVCIGIAIYSRPRQRLAWLVLLLILVPVVNVVGLALLRMSIRAVAADTPTAGLHLHEPSPHVAQSAVGQNMSPQAARSAIGRNMSPQAAPIAIGQLMNPQVAVGPIANPPRPSAPSEREEPDQSFGSSGVQRARKANPTSELSYDATRVYQLAERLAKKFDTKARRFSSFDFGRELDPTQISLLAPSDKAIALAKSIRINVPSVLAFEGTVRWLGDEQHEGFSEVVLLASADEFQAIQIARVDPVNHGLSTADVVQRLQQFADDYGAFQVLSASTDSVVIEFLKPVVEQDRMVAELIEFCPDLEHVAGREHVEKMVRVGVIEFWWD